MHNLLGRSHLEVAALCMLVWEQCDIEGVIDMSRNCHVPGVTLSYIDMVSNADGFGEAMLKVGWVRTDGDEHLIFPLLGRYVTKTGRERMLATKRKRAQRTASRAGHGHVTPRACPEEEGEGEGEQEDSFPDSGNSAGENLHSDSDEGHQGIQASAWLKLGEILRVACSAEKLTALKRQLAIAKAALPRDDAKISRLRKHIKNTPGDRSSLRQICEQVITTTDTDGANQQKAELIRLAHTLKGRDFPMSGFVPKCKEQFGVQFSRNGTSLEKPGGTT